MPKQNPHVDFPGPAQANEPTFIRQLRTWGRKVVQAIIQDSIQGDNRRIACTSLGPGNTTVQYIDSPDPDLSFHGYWSLNADYGNANTTLEIKAGKIYTNLGTVSVAAQSETPPGSGDKYYWVQVDYNFAAGTVSGTWSSGASFPTFYVDTDADGNYDRVNIPIAWIDEVTTGNWQLYQRQYGDAVLLSGSDMTSTDVVIDVGYSTSTGIFRKKMQTQQVWKGITTLHGTTTWAEVFEAAECTTTTTTT